LSYGSQRGNKFSGALFSSQVYRQQNGYDQCRLQE